MMLKIVYGSPPADEERIEDFEPEGENGIQEDEPDKTSQSVVSSTSKRQKGNGV